MSMSQANRSQRMPTRQKGMALVISLIFLLLLTIIGVTAMQTTTLQERMAGNMRDRNVAFQFAEEALRDAEVRLTDEDLSQAAGSMPEVYDPEDAPDWETIDDCSAGNVRQVGLDDFDGGELPSQAPCYFIEVLNVELENQLDPGEVGQALDSVQTTIFRVTAVGFGLASGTRVALQSTTAGTGDEFDNGDDD